jgi:hypothetical protein
MPKLSLPIPSYPPASPHPPDPESPPPLLQVLVRSLLVLSLVGALVLAGGAYYGSFDNPITPVYSLFMLIWISYFAKTWRHEEARLALAWNVNDFEARENAAWAPPRSEFKGPKTAGFYSPEG